MPWTGRVALSDEMGGFAYRPGEVIAVGEAARDAVLEDLPPDIEGTPDFLECQPAGAEPYFLIPGLPDALATIRRLRATELRVQPNHVFFSSPLWNDPVYASPVYASPVYASPVYASPVYASGRDLEEGYVLPQEATDISRSPVGVNPVYASPSANARYRATGERLSTVRTVDGSDGFLDTVEHPRVEVVVVDTGIPIAPPEDETTPPPAYRPPTRLDSSQPQRPFIGEGIYPSDPVDQQTGNLLRPAFGSAIDPIDDDQNGFIDPASGHGIFIAGIIERMAPGARIKLDRAFWPEGDGDEWDIVDVLARRYDNGTLPHVLNLSFSGYIRENEPWVALRKQIDLIISRTDQPPRKQTLVVAAAGNDATSRPSYPAAFPGVISVGAIGPVGPAPFTNYGPWVRACAPGVDIVSKFYAGTFNGPLNQHPQDPDALTGWAMWSGTSFSTPVVVGALARRMQRGLSGQTAVEEVISNPGLMRIPGLGTVVNEL
ncbi:MAG: S8/S53 family peptidase [Actinomycetota bacterium]